MTLDFKAYLWNYATLKNDVAAILGGGVQIPLYPPLVYAPHCSIIWTAVIRDVITGKLHKTQTYVLRNYTALKTNMKQWQA